MKLPQILYGSKLERAVQVVLLSIIVIGIGLLATQSLWVPSLVSFILTHG